MFSAFGGVKTGAQPKVGADKWKQEVDNWLASIARQPKRASQSPGSRSGSSEPRSRSRSRSRSGSREIPPNSGGFGRRLTSRSRSREKEMRGMPVGPSRSRSQERRPDLRRSEDWEMPRGRRSRSRSPVTYQPHFQRDAGSRENEQSRDQMRSRSRERDLIWSRDCSFSLDPASR